MTIKFKPTQFIKLLSFCLLTSSTLAWAQQAPVVVKGYGQHIGGNIVYHQQVTNNGSREVVRIAFGLDTDEQGSNLPLTRLQGELSFVMPVGMALFDVAVPPSSVTSPTGWTAQIIQIEDSGRYMQWRSPGHPQPAIQPGQTFRFSVTVPKYYDEYFMGHFSAGYADGNNPWYYNGAMEKLDTIPPNLTVTLSPNILRNNEKQVPITATITVSDDYDPQPEIKLESITANEALEKEDIKGALIGTDDRQFMLKAEREGKNKAGRIYTVTYSATDGSGNKTIVSATVTVPHDEREHEDKDRDEKSRKSSKD